MKEKERKYIEEADDKEKKIEELEREISTTIE